MVERKNKITKEILIVVANFAKKAYENKLPSICNEDKDLINFINNYNFSLSQRIKIYKHWKKYWVISDINRIKKELGGHKNYLITSERNQEYVCWNTKTYDGQIKSQWPILKK